MATQNKPAQDWFKNPKFNGGGQLVSFDGIKLVDNKADKSDAKTLELINKMRSLPRTNDSGDGGSSEPKVEINGKVYRLANKFFTEEETENYNNYRKGHTKTGTVKKGNESDEKTFDKLTEIINKFKDSKKDGAQEIVAELKVLRASYINGLGMEKLAQLLSTAEF